MPRITSGSLRNRKLDVPRTGLIRPMLERPRQALFSILGQDLSHVSRVFDCFAGTGVLGFEALSRGAEQACFFDTQPQHIKEIRKNAEKFKLSDHCRIFSQDVMRFLVPDTPLYFETQGDQEASQATVPKTTLVFLDPPHAMSNETNAPFYQWMGLLSQVSFLGPRSICVVGHEKRVVPDEKYDRWERFDQRIYGKVGLSFYHLA